MSKARRLRDLFVRQHTQPNKVTGRLFGTKLLTFLATFLPFFLRPVFQIFCQHVSILHQAVELLKVNASPEPLKMALQPAGNDGVRAFLVRIILDDRHNPIDGPL